MRLRPIFSSAVIVGGLFCSLAEAQGQDAKALMEAYQAQADDIAVRLLFSEFAKHPDRVHHLAFTFSLQIDARGRPHSVIVVSKTRNTWIEDSARRTLTGAKFPPCTKKAARAYGEPL